MLTPKRAITDAIVIGVADGLILQAISNARRRDLMGDLGEARLRITRDERRPAKRAAAELTRD